MGELRTQLQPPASPAETGPSQGTSILVRIFQKESTDLGEEGFRITAQKNSVELVAASWRGAHYALLDLVRVLAESPDGHSIPAGLNSQQRPSFEPLGTISKRTTLGLRTVS